MVRIPKNDMAVEGFELGSRQALHRPLGSNGHEHWRFGSKVREMEERGPGLGR